MLHQDNERRAAARIQTLRTVSDPRVLLRTTLEELLPVDHERRTALCVFTAYCERAAAEVARRPPLDETGRAQGKDAMNTVHRALTVRSACASSAACATSSTRHAPTAADVDASQRGLRDAGFGDVVVRIARPHDPAPTGSLLYAVAVGAGTCVVGHVADLPGGSGTGFVAGALPDGTCIDR
jgi:hypothetical protein